MCNKIVELVNYVNSKQILNMKSIKIWSLLAMLFIGMVGCTPVDDDKQPGNNGNEEIVGLVGEWVLTSWSETEPLFNVYVNFKDDNSFEMYEQVYSLTYELVTGTYAVSDGRLTGEYSDGSTWKSSYSVTVTEGEQGNMLQLVDESDVTSIYESTTIPEEVKIEASETRAAGAEHFL